jgi:hypothetical protein
MPPVTLQKSLIPVTRSHSRDSSGCPTIGKPMAASNGKAGWGFALPNAQDMLKHPPELHIAMKQRRRCSDRANKFALHSQPLDRIGTEMRKFCT